MKREHLNVQTSSTGETSVSWVHPGDNHLAVTKKDGAQDQHCLKRHPWPPAPRTHRGLVVQKVGVLACVQIETIRSLYMGLFYCTVFWGSVKTLRYRPQTRIRSQTLRSHSLHVFTETILSFDVERKITSHIDDNFF